MFFFVVISTYLGPFGGVFNIRGRVLQSMMFMGHLDHSKPKGRTHCPALKRPDRTNGHRPGGDEETCGNHWLRITRDAERSTTGMTGAKNPMLSPFFSHKNLLLCWKKHPFLLVKSMYFGAGTIFLSKILAVVRRSNLLGRRCIWHGHRVVFHAVQVSWPRATGFCNFPDSIWQWVKTLYPWWTSK